MMEEDYFTLKIASRVTRSFIADAAAFSFLTGGMGVPPVLSFYKRARRPFPLGFGASATPTDRNLRPSRPFFVTNCDKTHSLKLDTTPREAASQPPMEEDRFRSNQGLKTYKPKALNSSLPARRALQ